MKKYIAFLMIFVVLSLSHLSKLSASNCQNIKHLKEAAIELRDKDNIDLSTRDNRNKYIKELRQKLEVLESCIDYIEDPLIKLEVETLLNSIAGKIKEVSAIKDYKILNCDQCEDTERCRALCDEMKRRKEYWRRKYVKTFHGYDNLDCEKSLKDLETYYISVEDLINEGEYDLKQIYSKESITALWAILYSISKNEECLRKGQEKLRRIMLPFIMPASDLVRILSNKFKQLDEKEQKKLLKNEDDALYMINFIIEIFRRTDPDILYKLKIDPYNLADMLAKMIEKYPEYSDAVLMFPVMLPVENIISILRKKFEALTLEEQEKLLRRNEDAVFLVNFLIKTFRETDPNFITQLTLSEDDLAKILSNMIDYNPDIIRQLPEILPAGDLVTILAKRFGELTKEEQEKLLEREDDALLLINSLIQVFRKTDPNISHRLNLNSDELAHMLVSIIEMYPKDYKKVQKRVEGLSDKEIKLLFPAIKEAAIEKGIIYEPPIKKINNKYIKSFLMPGYIRSYYEKAPSPFVKMWNWSNYTILGLSLISELMFVESEYEDEEYYSAGVIGGWIFIVNGLLGILDAQQYESNFINSINRVNDSHFHFFRGFNQLGIFFTYNF